MRRYIQKENLMIPWTGEPGNSWVLYDEAEEALNDLRSDLFLANAKTKSLEREVERLKKK